MHELSHAMACLCYGGNFFEAGVTWQKFYPGTYVLIDKSGIDSKLKRVQVDAFIDGLDGSSVIGELLGLPDGVDGAKNLLRKELKLNIKEASENKKVAIISCDIMLVYQILLPIVLVNNILSIFGGFL